MLTPDAYQLPMEISLIIICAGISVGVAFASTIIWADSVRQVFFRFFRTLFMATLVILAPFWYPYAAMIVNTFLRGL